MSDCTVPCGTCRSCCKGGTVWLSKEEAERLPLHHVHSKDSFYLQRNRFGECVYLGPNGCTVYADRPKVCREFDCRNPEFIIPKWLRLAVRRPIKHEED